MSRREHPREGQAEEQQALLPGLAREGVRRARAAQRAAAPVETAATDPVAQVLLDLPLAHLDRLFDFAVPATMADDAQPGVRVKARFAGQETDGFIVARIAESEHTGRLQPLRRVVSPEPVLGPEVVALAGRLAQRYAGTRSDVLRLAVPPRHATTEKEQVDRADGVPLRVLAPERAEAAWADHEHAASWLRGVREGQPARAVWNPPPGTDWPRLVAEAALSTPGGVVVCLPDRRDVDRVDAALTAATGDGPPQHAVLTADLGPAARYRSFLSLSRGRRRIAVGTRAAAFAPVADLRLVVVWDDGDDLHAEPRAPYVHTREVLLSRAELTGAAALVGGFARTVEAHHLLRSGWAHPLTPPREQVRRSVTVSISGASDRELARDPAARAARIPSAVHALMREAVQEGPVLVQNPRSGYVPSLACERCRTPARCPACSGPMRLGGPTDPPSCGWCATPQPAWRCCWRCRLPPGRIRTRPWPICAPNCPRCAPSCSRFAPSLSRRARLGFGPQGAIRPSTA